MKDFVDVRCPRCGVMLDAEVAVKSVTFTDGDFKQPQVVAIHFKKAKVYDHECSSTARGT